MSGARTLAGAPTLRSWIGGRSKLHRFDVEEGIGRPDVGFCGNPLAAAGWDSGVHGRILRWAEVGVPGLGCGLRGPGQIVAGGAAEHPGHDAEIGLHFVEAGLVDRLAVDVEGAGEGDADAVDLVEIAVSDDFFVAAEVVDGDLADFEKGGGVEVGADDLAVGERDLQLVEAVSVDFGDAEEFDLFAFDQGIEQVPAGGGVADKIAGLRRRHWDGLRDAGSGIRAMGLRLV